MYSRKAILRNQILRLGRIWIRNQILRLGRIWIRNQILRLGRTFTAHVWEKFKS